MYNLTKSIVGILWITALFHRICVGRCRFRSGLLHDLYGFSHQFKWIFARLQLNANIRLSNAVKQHTPTECRRKRQNFFLCGMFRIKQQSAVALGNFGNAQLCGTISQHGNGQQANDCLRRISIPYRPLPQAQVMPRGRAAISFNSLSTSYMMTVSVKASGASPCADCFSAVICSCSSARSTARRF